MSELISATPFDRDTDVSLHAGDPELLGLTEAQELRIATDREQALAAEAARTPQGDILQFGRAVVAARRAELDEAA